MPYDEALAARVRRAFPPSTPFAERRMFGGLAFLVRGHMCCGVLKDDLVVRVGPERHAEALARPDARPMDFTGRPLKGFVYVGPGAAVTDASLDEWIRLGLDHVEGLPAKE